METLKHCLHGSSLRMFSVIMIADKKVAKAAWSMMAIGCSTCFLVFMIQSISLFLRYPVLSTVKVQSDRLEFPSVSVCPMNPYKLSAVMEKAPQLYRALSEYSASIMDKDNRTKRQVHIPQTDEYPDEVTPPQVSHLPDDWAMSHQTKIRQRRATPANIPDNVGKIFYATFLPDYASVGYSATERQFMLATDSDHPFNVTITNKNGGWGSKMITIDNTKVFTVAVNLDPDKAMTGFKIEAPNEFVLYSMSTADLTADATLHFPLDVLGTDYAIMGVDNKGYYKGFVIIVATADATTVTATYTTGAIKTSNIDEMGVMILEFPTSDPSGTSISASSPVAVLTGNDCLYYPSDYFGCDIVFEQLTPTNTHGTKFALTPFVYTSTDRGTCNPWMPNMRTEFFKVLAILSGTTITRTGLTTETWSLNAGEVKELATGQDEYSYLTSNQPVIVAHIMPGYCYVGSNGDPSLVILPPLDSLRNSYFVVSCNPVFNKHLMTILIDTSKASGLLLNGVSISISTMTPHPITGTSYSAYQYEFKCSSSSMSYRINHTDVSVLFGVIGYGMGSSISYSYVAGRLVGASSYFCTNTTDSNPPDGLDNDCDGRTDEELRNFIDDDNDGRIDEDLAAHIPTINVSDSTIVSDVLDHAPSPSQISEPVAASAYVDPRCIPYNLSHIDEEVNSGMCLAVFSRTWSLVDNCGNIADNKTQIITIARMEPAGSPPCGQSSSSVATSTTTSSTTSTTTATSTESTSTLTTTTATSTTTPEISTTTIPSTTVSISTVTTSTSTSVATPVSTTTTSNSGAPTTTTLSTSIRSTTTVSSSAPSTSTTSISIPSTTVPTTASTRSSSALTPDTTTPTSFSTSLSAVSSSNPLTITSEVTDSSTITVNRESTTANISSTNSRTESTTTGGSNIANTTTTTSSTSVPQPATSMTMISTTSKTTSGPSISSTAMTPATSSLNTSTLSPTEKSSTTTSFDSSSSTTVSFTSTTVIDTTASTSTSTVFPTFDVTSQLSSTETSSSSPSTSPLGISTATSSTMSQEEADSTVLDKTSTDSSSTEAETTSSQAVSLSAAVATSMRDSTAAWTSSNDDVSSVLTTLAKSSTFAATFKATFEASTARSGSLTSTIATLSTSTSKTTSLGDVTNTEATTSVESTSTSDSGSSSMVSTILSEMTTASMTPADSSFASTSSQMGSTTTDEAAEATQTLAASLFTSAVESIRSTRDVSQLIMETSPVSSPAIILPAITGPSTLAVMATSTTVVTSTHGMSLSAETESNPDPSEEPIALMIEVEPPVALELPTIKIFEPPILDSATTRAGYETITTPQESSLVSHGRRFVQQTNRPFVPVESEVFGTQLTSSMVPNAETSSISSIATTRQSSSPKADPLMSSAVDDTTIAEDQLRNAEEPTLIIDLNEESPAADTTSVVIEQSAVSSVETSPAAFPSFESTLVVAKATEHQTETFTDLSAAASTAISFSTTSTPQSTAATSPSPGSSLSTTDEPPFTVQVGISPATAIFMALPNVEADWSTMQTEPERSSVSSQDRTTNPQSSDSLSIDTDLSTSTTLSIEARSSESITIDSAPDDSIFTLPEAMMSTAAVDFLTSSSEPSATTVQESIIDDLYPESTVMAVQAIINDRTSSTPATSDAELTDNDLGFASVEEFKSTPEEEKEPLHSASLTTVTSDLPTESQSDTWKPAISAGKRSIAKSTVSPTTVADDMRLIGPGGTTTIDDSVVASISVHDATSMEDLTMGATPIGSATISLFSSAPTDFPSIDSVRTRVTEATSSHAEQVESGSEPVVEFLSRREPTSSWIDKSIKNTETTQSTVTNSLSEGTNEANDMNINRESPALALQSYTRGSPSTGIPLSDERSSTGDGSLTAATPSSSTNLASAKSLVSVISPAANPPMVQTSSAASTTSSAASFSVHFETEEPRNPLTVGSDPNATAAASSSTNLPALRESSSDMHESPTVSVQASSAASTPLIPATMTTNSKTQIEKPLKESSDPPERPTNFDMIERGPSLAQSFSSEPSSSTPSWDTPKATRNRDSEALNTLPAITADLSTTTGQATMGSPGDRLATSVSNSSSLHPSVTGQSSASDDSITSPTADEPISSPTSAPLDPFPTPSPPVDPIAWAAQLEDALPYLVHSLNLDDSLLEALSYGIDDFVFWCHYGGRPCQMDKELTTFRDPNYGNCITFNPQAYSHYSRRAGQRLGLRMIFRTPSFDYLPFIISSGYKIVLHEPREDASMISEEIACSAGEYYNFAVSKTEYTLPGQPYRVCASDKSISSAFNTTKAYSTELCLTGCYQRMVIAWCDCADPHYPLPVGSTYCNLTKKTCVDEAAQRALDGIDSSNCDCPPACRSAIHNFAQTKAVWPSINFRPPTCNDNSNFSQCHEEFRNSNSRLDIYYTQMSSISIEVNPGYTIFNLASDTFANVGLWVGMCAVSIIELVAFPLVVIYECLNVKTQYTTRS